ncbi:hypothetical protein CRUP_037412, partial [Coryphaenoides rupestris]
MDLQRLHLDLFKLSKKYGSVFTIHLGRTKVVVLAGYETVKKGLVNHAVEFGERYISPVFYDLNKENGLIFSNGETWKEMRRFALSALRNYGMGKKMIEEKIIEECAAFDSRHVVHYAASNIISSIIYGHRFEYNDHVFEEMVARDNETIRLLGSVTIQVYNTFPWLGRFLKTWKTLMKHKEDAENDVRRLIKSLKETLNPQMPRCIVDSFLVQKNLLEESGIMDSQYHEDNLLYCVTNLFAAGTDTTGHTLSWSLLFMAKYPHIQGRVQVKLDLQRLHLDLFKLSKKYGSVFTIHLGRTKVVVLAGYETVKKGLVYNTFPWLGRFLKTWKTLMKHKEDAENDVRRLIKSLKETLNPQMPRCIVDSFLVQKNLLEESGIMDSQYHEDNLLYCVINLFAAGTDTTGHTLSWSLLFMAKYPHIQDQVQEELSRVIGSRQVSVQDRKNLPYTDAVIHETQRLADIVPMAIPHITSQDVNFQGFFIRKGTPVIPLLTSVLHDETEWENPLAFNPSHFLDEEGKFVNRDAFMVFSAGRRACPGEGLARMELFLFFTSLLQRFRFTPPPGVTEDELDLTPVPGFTLGPKPHS